MFYYFYCIKLFYSILLHVIDVWNDDLVKRVIESEVDREGQLFVIVPFIKDCQG